MTIKKTYQNGKLVYVGFDSLEEIFAYKNNLDLLEDVPSHELELKEGAKEIIRKNPKFKKFVEENNKFRGDEVND